MCAACGASIASLASEGRQGGGGKHLRPHRFVGARLPVECLHSLPSCAMLCMDLLLSVHAESKDPTQPYPAPPTRSLWETLGRCPQLGSRLSGALDLARCRFIDQQLLPMLNRQGENGW